MQVATWSELEDAEADGVDANIIAPYLVVSEELYVSGEWTVSSSVSATLDAQGKHRIFHVEADGELTLVGVTLVNGYDAYGGCLYTKKNSVKLTLIDVSAFGCVASGYGGVITANSEVSIIGGRFENNSSPDGKAGLAFFKHESEVIGA